MFSIGFMLNAKVNKNIKLMALRHNNVVRIAISPDLHFCSPPLFFPFLRNLIIVVHGKKILSN